MIPILPSDPALYAGFILKHMLKTLPPFPGAHRGVAETEHPIEGDDWFWADDNAKVLELLGLPGVWHRYPDEVRDILTFLMGFCDGPLIFRRIARARLEQVAAPEGEVAFIHGLMNIGAEPAKGVVTLGMRFHDGRTARNVRLGGNFVQFSYRGIGYTLDAEEAITDHDVSCDGGVLRFRWHAELFFVHGLLNRNRLRLGRLTTTTTVRADTMFVDIETALDLDPGLDVSDVVLTFGFDDVSTNDNNVRYEELHLLRHGGEAVHAHHLDKGLSNIRAHDARYWCMAQRSHMRGFALAVHTLVLPGSRPYQIGIQSREAGQFHWVTSQHRFEGSHRGATLRAAERKVITAGGFYDDANLYADVLERHAGCIGTGAAPVDLSISYDYGAEVKAFARCYRTLAGASPPIDDPVLCERLRDLVDRFQETYQTYLIGPSQLESGAIFSRSIAFMAFAYADMLAATGEARYRDALREACGIIATFERENEDVAGFVQSGFLMGKAQDALPYPDCHGACLLALVRASAILETDAWVAAIDRGLGAYRIDTIKLFFLGWQKQDIVGVDYKLPDGSRRTLDMYWNFSVGITLRLFNALRGTRFAPLAAVWTKHAPRLALLETLMRQRLSQSLRPREETIEILTSILSAETNSETQPWVALALIGEEAADGIM